MAYSTPRTWVTNEVVTAAQMNQEIRDNLDAGFPDEVSAVAWTPILDGTIASGTVSVSGRQWRVGPLQFVWVRFSGNEGEWPGGTFFVTLPSTAVGLTAFQVTGQVIGEARLLDLSASSNRTTAAVILASSTTVQFGRVNGANVTDSAPFNWNTGDVLTFQAVYPIA